MFGPSIRAARGFQILMFVFPQSPRSQASLFLQGVCIRRCWEMRCLQLRVSLSHRRKSVFLLEVCFRQGSSCRYQPGSLNLFLFSYSYQPKQPFSGCMSVFLVPSVERDLISCTLKRLQWSRSSAFLESKETNSCRHANE